MDDSEVIDVMDDKMNRTFQNPSQTNKSKNDNKAVEAPTYECDMCEFKSVWKYEIRDHKGKIHNWCYLCYSIFENQMKLETHIKAVHNET